jgi:hypothetical protein
VDYESSIEKVDLGIPQGSPISPILYLFYNADLLEESEDLVLSITSMGFIDDISLLTYSDSTERNVRNLEKAYRKCLNWARSHGSRFNPEKSELIHFIGRRKAYSAPITLEGEIIKPSKSIRLLGVFLDQGLTHKAHFGVLEERVPKLLGALKSITSSTWGTSLISARKLYKGAIRPALAYGASFWCPKDFSKAKTLAENLQSIQGRFLRAITGAYKATSIEALEIETFIEPLDLYLEKTANQGAARQVLRGYGKEGSLFREILRNRFRRRGRPRQESSALSSRETPRDSKPEIIDFLNTEETQISGSTRWERYKKALETFYASKWKDRWEKSEKGRAITSFHPQPTQKALKLYKNRAKPFSSILIQLRTEKIGLNGFLKRARVPNIEALCECKEAEETVEHFLFKCSRWNEQRAILGGLKTIREALGERENSEKVVKYLLATGRLEQYSRIDHESALKGLDK